MHLRKHIPNTITSMNLLCGVLGIVAAASGRIQSAFILMLCGAVCDFFDGLSARALGAYSPMGKELDSQADQVTFGVLPAFLLFCVCKGHVCCGLACIPLLIAVFSGLRLAKFNIDERQSTSFIGLPTPASAMIAGSIACYVSQCPSQPLASFMQSAPFVIIVSLTLCALLISEIPMFSMKMHKGEKIGAARIAFAVAGAAGVAAVLVLGLHWSLILTFLFTGYIIINIVEAILKK